MPQGPLEVPQILASEPYPKELTGRSPVDGIVLDTTSTRSNSYRMYYLPGTIAQPSDLPEFVSIVLSRVLWFIEARGDEVIR